MKLFHMENQQLKATIEREIQARQSVEQQLNDIQEDLDEKFKLVSKKIH